MMMAKEILLSEVRFPINERISDVTKAPNASVWSQPFQVSAHLLFFPTFPWKRCCVRSVSRFIKWASKAICFTALHRICPLPSASSLLSFRAPFLSKNGYIWNRCESIHPPGFVLASFSTLFEPSSARSFRLLYDDHVVSLRSPDVPITFLEVWWILPIIWRAQNFCSLWFVPEVLTAVITNNLVTSVEWFSVSITINGEKEIVLSPIAPSFIT